MHSTRFHFNTVQDRFCAFYIYSHFFDSLFEVKVQVNPLYTKKNYRGVFKEKCEQSKVVCVYLYIISYAYSKTHLASLHFNKLAICG